MGFEREHKFRDPGAFTGEMPGVHEMAFFQTVAGPDATPYPAEEDNPTVYYARRLKNPSFTKTVGAQAITFDLTDRYDYVFNLETATYIEEGSVLKCDKYNNRWWTIDKVVTEFLHYVRLNLDGSQEWWVSLVPGDQTGNDALKAGRIELIGTDGVTVVTGDTLQRRDTDGELIWRAQYPADADDPPERNLIGAAYAADAGAVFAIRTTYDDEFNVLTPNPAVPNDEDNQYATPRTVRKVWLVKINATTGAEITDDPWPILLSDDLYFPLNPVNQPPVESGYLDGEWFAIAARRDWVYAFLLTSQADRPPLGQIAVSRKFNATTGAEQTTGRINGSAFQFDGFGPWVERCDGEAGVADMRFPSGPREFLYSHVTNTRDREIQRTYLGTDYNSSGEITDADLIDVFIPGGTQIGRFHCQPGGWITTTMRTTDENLTEYPEWNVVVRRVDVALVAAEQVASDVVRPPVLMAQTGGGSVASWVGNVEFVFGAFSKATAQQTAAVDLSAHFTNTTAPGSVGNVERIATDGTLFWLKAQLSADTIVVDSAGNLVAGPFDTNTETRYFRWSPAGLLQWGSTRPSTFTSSLTVFDPMGGGSFSPLFVNPGFQINAGFTDADADYIYCWCPKTGESAALHRFNAADGTLANGGNWPVRENAVPQGFTARFGVKVIGDYIYCIGDAGLTSLTPALYKLDKDGNVLRMWYEHPWLSWRNFVAGHNFYVDETDGVGGLYSNLGRWRLWVDPQTGTGWIVPTMRFNDSTNSAISDPDDRSVHFQFRTVRIPGGAAVEEFWKWDVVHDDVKFAREWFWEHNLETDPVGGDNINPREPPLLYSADYDPDNDRVYMINPNDTGAADVTTKTVVCFDAATHYILWQRGYKRPHDVRVVNGKAHVSHRGMASTSEPQETSENTEEPHTTDSDKNEYTGEEPL